MKLIYDGDGTWECVFCGGRERAILGPNRWLTVGTAVGLTSDRRIRLILCCPTCAEHEPPRAGPLPRGSVSMWASMFGRAWRREGGWIPTVVGVF